MDTPTPKKPNGLLAPLTTSATTMTIVKIGAMMTATAAKMTASPDVMTAQIAREADKAVVAGLITRSTPSIPVTP